jgi:LmbE family N-acetylglucosaminyl deacetylase
VNLLLAPHSDDEALFASYVQLAYQPHVVVCLQGRRARHLPRNDVREAESRASADVLGTTVEFIESPCDPADWHAVEQRVAQFEPHEVFAPLPEMDGSSQHNAIGNLAAGLWPIHTTFYATYGLHNGRTQEGQRLGIGEGWPLRKQKALACFVSQSSKPDTAMHFMRDTAEYLTKASDAYARNGHPEKKLNLGAGQKKLRGFKNLDPAYKQPWRFEDGLSMYEDESVDAITTSHALMYVPEEVWPAAFAEMARVLRPGGVLRITGDNIGGEGSTRTEIRPGASVATSPEKALQHLEEAGLGPELVTANISVWHDRSLIQTNYGEEPDVFHVEGVKG